MAAKLAKICFLFIVRLCLQFLKLFSYYLPCSKELGCKTQKNQTGASMSTNDIESVIEITKSLGDAYLSLLNTADADTGVEALEQIVQARQTTQENMEQDEYDFAAPVTATFRATELKILSTVLPIMKPTCVAFENFSKSTNGKKFREYWNSTSEGVNNPLFTSNFRKLWRDSMNEELIVKIGTITKSSGAWPATVTSVYELAPVVAATTGILPTTPVYSNGSSGVGATLTAGSAEALGTIDGVTINPGDRILVKNQTTAAQNGIYIVSSIGSSSVKWILTRSTDADTASATKVSHGMSVYVTNGSVNGSKKFYMSTNSSVTMGSTNLNFTKTNLCPIERNENLELRVIGNANLPTTDEITVTITIRKTDLTTSLHTVTIPANTVAGTGFAIGGSGVSVSGISIASDNGVDGDTLEIWVAGTTNALPLTTVDETDNIYQLHPFTLQDNRSELETLINSASAGSVGSHTIVNLTSSSVYACPGRLNTNIMQSLRGAGILSRLVALTYHPSFNLSTHPVFASEQPGVISDRYLSALEAATDPGTPGDGSAVLARQMTQAVIDGGFASATTNGTHGAYMMNDISVIYHLDTIKNGSQIPTPPGVSNIGINISIDGEPLTTYWSSTPVFKYPIAP